MQVKWLANLLRDKAACLTCTPFSVLNRPVLEAIVADRRSLAQVSDEGRTCLTCGKWKLWDQFSNDERRIGGKTSNCIECGHWRTVKALFGLTGPEWEWLYAQQDGRCALCSEPETANQRLSVDHDHSCCGVAKGCKRCIRGLLCATCNRMLGHVENKPLIAARFADYLARRPFAPAAAHGA